jgi:exodeoxyribonuclease V gamma subunit
MPQVNLHVSNQLDLLAAALAEATARPLVSPFTPETVVVQSVAARRWLSLRLAELQKICANYEFPFLGTVMANLIGHAHDGPSPAERPAPDLLTWRIESALRRCPAMPEFAAVAGYLADGDSLKRFTLAGRIAALFDQYRVYRPDLLIKWSAHGPAALRGDEAWQAKLWLEVDGSSDFDRALAGLRAHGFSRQSARTLPARLSVFAPTTLAPAYLDLLFQLGRVCEVHLFLLRPTATYHGDDLAPKARARLGLAESGPPAGHPLLASWGRAAAELTDLLLDTEDRFNTAATSASEQFHDPAPRDLLTTLQHQIFLAAGADPQPGQTKQPVAAHDRSLVINACHSPMREVEVLYDHLLDCFARDPQLRPRDILVMTPEIEKYAPLVRAVFEYPEDESLRIPYSIADRHPRSESPAIDMFLTLLGLADTRYTAPDIFLLLSSRPLRRRFALSDDDLSLIRTWIGATAIRWGIDARHKTTKGVPAEDANTWRHGLDRLLLGFAFEGRERQLFAGILPQDDVEGDGAQTLGRFITAAEALFGIQAAFTTARPLAAWVEPLLRLIAEFFEPLDSEDIDDVRHLRAIIGRLGSLAESVPAAEPVDFPAVRQFLEDQVGAMEQRGSFLTGGVTFCAPKPVRGIPARVICVLGLNDQVFPRRPRVAPFDLMAARRRGDPSAGADDRLAFLETVLSARGQLSLSYVGRSVQDNKRIPPSVVVSELLDYLNQAFAFPEGQTAEQFLVLEHPLHAFSPRYFAVTPGEQQLFDFAAPPGAGRLFSYSRANAEASRGILSGENPAPPLFLSAPLPEPAFETRAIELPDLVRFWGSPSEYFVRRRLGLRLGQNEQELAADEPFSLNQWDQYPIKQELLADKLGFAKAGSPPAFAARGVLAPGAIGELQLRSLDAGVERFAQVVRAHLNLNDRKPPKDIRLVAGEFTLGGRLNSLYGAGTLHFRCATLKPKDQLRAWIEHLALCASDTAAAPHRSILIGTDAVVSFDQVEDASSQLDLLCRRFAEGATRPLPFFPASALAYADAEMKGTGDPLKPALQKWHGGWNITGENEDRHVVCCFGPGAPLPEEFFTLAREVCLPLLSHAQSQSL